ncbi:MAG: glycosyltransferase [Bacteroidales bacterium]|nr:glycosyltransferase [Bacteroidales bacterium]
MFRVSVIIPIYNTAKYLPRCIESVLCQSFDGFELLLVNDGSTDGSGDICDTYATRDSRIRVFHKENGGVSSARNLGLKEAKGEWVCFVDSDDELLPDGLQTMVDGVSSDVDLVMAGYYGWIEETLVMDTSCFGTDGIIDRDKALLMMYSNSPYMGYSWGKFFNRNIIMDRCISFDEHVRIKEDTLFVTEYLCGIQKQIHYISIPVYKYLGMPSGVMYGLANAYNPDYLTSFDAVVKMHDMICGLPNISKALLRVARYWVVDRVYFVYGHMLKHGTVDNKLVAKMKAMAVRKVGLGYYLGYQYSRNKRRIVNLFRKRISIFFNVKDCLSRHDRRHHASRFN